MNPTTANPNFSGVTSNGSYASGTPSFSSAPTAVPVTGGALPGSSVSNQGLPGYDVFGNPVSNTPTYSGTGIAPAAPVTSMSSSNIAPVVAANNQTMQNISTAPRGNQADTTGVQRYSNGNLAPAPSDAIQEVDENGKSIPVWRASDGKTYGVSSSNAGMDPNQAAQNAEIERLKSKASAQLVTTLSNLQNQWGDLIKKQTKINTGAQAGLDKGLLMGGSTRYSASAGSISTAMQNSGLDEISSLVDKENNAIAAAQAAYDTNNNQLVATQLKIAQDASDNQQKVAQKMLENLAAAQTDAKTKQDQVNIDNGVATQMASGVVDPAKIIANLKAQGITVNAKQINDSIDNLNPHAKEISTMLTESFKNNPNIPADVLKQAGQSKDLNGAIAILGKYLQDPTSNAGQYQTAITTGYKGTYEDWFAAKQYKDTYQSALATADAKAEVDRKTGANGASATGVISSDTDDVLSGRNTLYNIRQSMGRSSKSQSYMENLRLAIKKQDPTFDFVASDAGGKFMSSSYFQKNVSSINSAVADVKIATDLSDQIKRVGVKGIESLLQSGQVQVNNQKVASLKQAQKLLADSVGIALGQGAVSDMKLQLGYDITDTNVSPEVFFSNMGIVKQFLENRKQALEDQRYKSSTNIATMTPDQIDKKAVQKIADFRTSYPKNEDIYQGLKVKFPNLSPIEIVKNLGIDLNK